MNQYWIELKQHGAVVGRVLIYCADNWEAVAEKKASELLESGLIEVGYYDCVLYKDATALTEAVLIA
jgi:hypothetical protein